MTELDKVLNKIKEENEIKYGKIQDCCGFHKAYCRCGTESETSKFLKNRKSSK
jgi:hypothetical protein